MVGSVPVADSFSLEFITRLAVHDGGFSLNLEFDIRL